MPVPWMLWVSKVVILKSYRFSVPAMFVFSKETWEGSRLLSTQILRTSNKSFLWPLLSDSFIARGFKACDTSEISGPCPLQEGCTRKGREDQRSERGWLGYLAPQDMRLNHPEMLSQGAKIRLLFGMFGF